MAAAGIVPLEAARDIRERGAFEVARIEEIEQTTGHDVIAFLTVLNESIGQPEARYVHLGMTSQDLNDTAMAVQLVESARIIGADLASVREAAADVAVQHRRTLMAGRTHGVVAEPTTFGFKVAGWVAELDRAKSRLERATDEVAVGRVSGAVGTHATVDPRVEEHVCTALGLRPDAVSTQVIARDVHASFMSALALVAGNRLRLVDLVSARELGDPAGQEFPEPIVELSPDGSLVVTSQRDAKGELDGPLRVVTSGLSTSDRLVVNGLLRARPGARVQPEEAAAAAAKGR